MTLQTLIRRKIYLKIKKYINIQNCVLISINEGINYNPMERHELHNQNSNDG